MKRIITCLLLLAALLPHAAAQTIVEARLDTASILIGEQVQLAVRVKADARQGVRFPSFSAEQQIVPGVEVVANGRIDTTLHNAGQRLEMERKYTVTSFDSALYNIVPYVLVGQDTVKARSGVGLKVSTVKVDTAHVENFRGPHAPVDGFFVWTSRLLWLSLLLVLLAFVAFALCVRLSDKKPVTRRVVVKPPTPPHKQAMSDIEGIRTMPKASRDEAKAYYMRLTSILRTYIQARFGLNAREMTSRQIIDRLTQLDDPAALHELREVLETADLVKFAKYESTLTESDRAVMQAIDFVNTTKLEVPQDEQPRECIVTLGETKQRSLRRLMWGALALDVLAAAGLAAYLVADIWTTFF